MAQKRKNVVGLHDPCFNVMLFHKNTKGWDNPWHGKYKGWEELCKGKGSIFWYRKFHVVLVLVVRFILSYRVIPNKKDVLTLWYVFHNGKKSSCDRSWVKARCLRAEKQIASLHLRWRPSWPSVLSSKPFVAVFCGISLVTVKITTGHVHRHNRGHVSQDLPLWQTPLRMWLKNTNCGESPCFN